MHSLPATGQAYHFRAFIIYLHACERLDVPALRCRAFFEARYAELDAELFSKHREAFPKDVFTRDTFLWAVATVRSRVHSPLDGDYVALVPLADLVSRAQAPYLEHTSQAWQPLP